MPAAGEEYLEPAYYTRILKPYVFSGQSDLALLEESLSRVSTDTRTVLELGPGTGRATQLLFQKCVGAHYTGVDLSSRMVESSVNRFGAERLHARWIVQDAAMFLDENKDQYDLVVSLWSISHAIHQSIARTGGTAQAERAVWRLFTECVSEGGHVFIVHFDSRSDEQLLSIRHRGRVWPFLKIGAPSPSECIFTSACERLSRKSGWQVNIRRLIGNDIVYASMEEALEVYMNFHMEGWFNSRPERDTVLEDLEISLREHALADGSIRVRPGCVAYEVKRPFA